MNGVIGVDFWRDLIVNVLGVFLGAVFGLGTALWIDRRQKAFQKQAEDAELDKRKTKIRNMILFSISQNGYTIDMLSQERAKNDYSGLFARFDTRVLDATASIKYEIMHDYEFCRNV